MKRLFTIVDVIVLVSICGTLLALGFVVWTNDFGAYDTTRIVAEKEAAPRIEALLTATTKAPAKCVLEPTLWAVLTPGVKFEGMVSCSTKGATYHTQIYVTRYANDDGQLFWKIGDLQRTEPGELQAR